MNFDVSRRLGQSGGRWWQVATRWGTYVEYLESLVDRLGTMDLPGMGPVRLDESFVAVRLRAYSETTDPTRPTRGSGISVTLQEAVERHSRLLVVGPAGTGKSALLRWHAIDMARDVLSGGRRAMLAEGAPWLPVYVALSGGAEGPLEEQLVRAMREAGFADASPFLDAHLTSGRTVILIDDLDTLLPDERRVAAARIADLDERYPGNRLVVATRDIADSRWFPHFEAFEVAGVDHARLESLAGHWGFAAYEETRSLLQVLERFPLVGSLAGRPGWFAIILGQVVNAEFAASARSGEDGHAPATGANKQHPAITANDVLEGFVQHIDPSGNDIWPDIARRMQEARSTVASGGEAPANRRSSGLLQWLDNDTFRFIHRAVQAHFASLSYATDRSQVEKLVEQAGDAWWSPVIILSTSNLADPRPVMERLLQEGWPDLAALTMAEIREPPEDLANLIFSALLSRLGIGNPEQDQADAIALAALLGGESVRKTGVISPVLSTLESDSAAVRREAAAALGRLSNPAGIPGLLTAIGDPDGSVRDAASDSLATFGDRTVQPLVRQLSVSNEIVRHAAIRALSRQGRTAVPALLPLLEVSSATLRAEAAEALAQIGAPAVPALVRIVRGGAADERPSEAQIEAASQALMKIGKPAAIALVPALPDAPPALHTRVARIMEAIGDDAINALGTALESADHPHSGVAAAMLGELPNIGANGARYLVGALTDGRFEVRWEVRRAIKRQGDVVTNTLLEALSNSDPQVRWEAAQLLLALPEPPTEELRAVLTGMLESTDVAERRRAVRALGNLSGTLVRETLESALDDSDPIVRRSAMSQLGRIGDPHAFPILKERWENEDDEEARLILIDALGELDLNQAVPVMIDALADDDDTVRRRASDLLQDVGEPAVIPLVVALNQRPGELDLAGALRVLDAVGSSTRAGGQSPANLARAYHRMLVESLEVEELVYLSTTIEWWPPALELHRTFSSLREFLDYTSLAGIGNAEKSLEWVDAIEDWLRPSAGRALRQLRSISQAVQYYNRGASRRSKEKGLLAAADRLNSLRSMIGELGEPHDRVFNAVTEHWSELINEAIRELQGKADLQLEIRTDHVRIRDVETSAVLVFELANRGEGLASNIQLSLKAEETEVGLLSTPVHYLPPLGQGDRIATEFTVRRDGEGVVPLTLEVKYDDPQVEGQNRKFVREVRFFVEETPYKDIGTSPYIAGPPVKTPAMFYGREAIFNWIQENLSGTYQDNVLVLYGERRTGKTSVLYQLQYRLPETYAFVLVDLQSIAYALGSTSDLLYAMARKTSSGLRKAGLDVPKPDRDAFAEHPIEEFVSLGESIGDHAVETGRRAVLMVDEFDLLIEAVDRGNVSPFVFDCIRGLMQHQDGLSFVFAGAHLLTAMLKNPQSILFNTALRRKVSFLEKEEAERLIREPVKDVLWYDDLAVEKILRVTAGQPYFIQYICHEIVNLARRDSRNFVALRDVDRALQTTVQETTGIIRHSYMSLGRDEQLALACLASIADDGRPFVSLEDLAETLRQDNIHVGKRELFETLRQLAERDFIVERGSEGTSRQYGFAMDLVRVWLEQNDEYTRIQEELKDDAAA